MDKVPPEICTEICAFACLDSGHTGRSLSLVSKFVHEASQPTKLQSISLHGQSQITAFASLLQRTPSHLCRVKYLFISQHDPYPLRGGSWDLRCVDFVTEREKRLISAIQSILKDVSEAVEILEVACLCHFDSKFDATHPISLPRLKELTTHYGFALEQTIFGPCHQLRRMHIVQPHRSDLFGGIRNIAPSLTHLRFSGLQREVVKLEVALEIREEASRLTRGSSVAILPSSVQNIIVKPSGPPARRGTHAESYQTQLRRLNEMGERFVLLKAQDDTIYDDSDWLDRIAGGDGCWSLADHANVTSQNLIFPPK